MCGAHVSVTPLQAAQLLPAAAADPSFSLLPQVPIAGRSSFSSPTATYYTGGEDGEGEEGWVLGSE